jgi:FtsP/CotA-like multicopper oxidase with cupredoxin domain
MNRYIVELARRISLLVVLVITLLTVSPAQSAIVVPLDPTTIPKYVTPLVIPPQMPKSTASPAPAADYDIAVRQFKQQILPGGIWGSSFPNPAGGAPLGPFPATTVWSYGRAEDQLPDSSEIPGGAVGVAPAPDSTFNYPAFTIENRSGTPTSVRWINDLVDPVSGTYLPHLFPVDQTLHWANPPKANCAMDDPNRTDCETMVPEPYTGPVPLVTHVHGAHVQPDSDGFPEAWWLPGAPGTKGIPASYAPQGSAFTQANNGNTVAGSAFYSYQNSQPATTLWYHDHALGMTRLNVYAGPAGFWLVRGGTNDVAAGILPGPAPNPTEGDPNFEADARGKIREIPVAIQDRSFNSDGSLFYPTSRAFFDGFVGPYIGTMTPGEYSDISAIWNPEAFFNTMVVNGTTWPLLEAAPARYRLRLLNGCNSRTINLSMFMVTSLGADGIAGTADDVLGAEVPFYQIGADQGFLPKVVRIQTGQVTTLPGNGTFPAATPTSAPEQALLMGPAERADVIVDFSGLANGTRIRMINTAPDAPFGGFPDAAADPLTTGQVMDFIINGALLTETDGFTTPPQNLVLPAETHLGTQTSSRMLSLNELMSDQVCVEIDSATEAIVGTLFTRPPADPTFLSDCLAATPTIPGNITDAMGPRQARLGIMTIDPLTGNLLAQNLKWGDPVSEFPLLNSTEVWEIFNTTVDAHPIHLHLVRFEVVNRQDLDPATLLPLPGTVTLPQPNELGYKDTVVAYPGQVTRIKARFDIAGRYVWHCHIVEHEDNEMMRSFIVGSTPNFTITAGAGANGFITQSGATAVVSGGNQAYAIKPDPGFKVAALVVDGTLLPGAVTYTFANVTTDHYINAYFAPSDVTVTAAAATNGTISPAGEIAVTPGSSQTYTITPDPGFMVVALSVDGAVLPGATSHTFTDITASHYINAYFAPSDLTIKAAAAANGSISPAGVIAVTPGSSQAYTITPDPGFLVAALSVDGTVLPGTTSYTFSGVNASHYINAYFAPLPAFTVTAAAAANGSISPAGATTVTVGTDQTYTITPDPGFTVAAIVVDGTLLPGATSYTFTNVTTEHYINAYFQ